MSMLIKLSLSILFFIFAIVATAPPTLAIEPDVSPGNIGENTPRATITFSELAHNRDFIVCRNSDSGYNDGFNHGCKGGDRIEKNSGSNGIIRITVCGDGDGKVKEGCDSNDFFHGDKTYKVYLLDGSQEGNILQTASFYVAKYIPTIFLFSRSPTTIETLKILVCGNRRPASKPERNIYDFDLNSTDDAPNPEDPNDVTVPATRSESITNFGNIDSLLAQISPSDIGKCANEPYAVEPFQEELNGGNYRITVRHDQEDFVLWGVNFSVTSTGGNIGDPFVELTFPEPTSEGGFLNERTKKLVNNFVIFGFGIAGGVAFLLLIYGGFKFIFSMGNPENVQQGREIITAAIIGLLVVVFSVFLLRLIGISILGLPI